MNEIEKQIEVLENELHPDPKLEEVKKVSEKSYQIHKELWKQGKECSIKNIANRKGLFDSEEDDYYDCYSRLFLYQLLAEKAEKNFPINWKDDKQKWATEFNYWEEDPKKDAIIQGGVFRIKSRISVLGSVWFSREEDRLEALKICGIDRAFQEKCFRFKLGG